MKKKCFKNHFEKLQRNQFFAQSDKKVWANFGDFEVTQISFKDPSSFMAVQDRRGFILVKDGKVRLMQKYGKIIFLILKKFFN